VAYLSSFDGDLVDADAATVAIVNFDDGDVLYGTFPDAHRALGGPGSGWTAENGHVPGSQGGNNGDVDLSGGHKLVDVSNPRFLYSLAYAFINARGEKVGVLDLVTYPDIGLTIHQVNLYTDVERSARGLGLARQAVDALVSRYGKLSSDPQGNTSADAHKMWAAVGGRKVETDKNTRGFYWTKTRADLRSAGGPGSGNFGHAGRPGEVGGSADRSSATAFGTTDPYVYHLTHSELPLSSFQQHGIKPSEVGIDGPGVYLANTPEATQYYDDLKTGRLLRVDKVGLIERFGRYPEQRDGVQYDDFTGEVTLSGDRAIPRDLIEVRQRDGTWRALEFNPDQPRDDDGQWADGSSAAPDADHETLRLYTQTGGTYREVNEGLRGGKDMAAHPTVVALDKAFVERGVPAPAVVYRGIAGYEPEELNLEEGKTFTDPGFVSTASVKSDAVKFATHGAGTLEGTVDRPSEAVGIIFKINTGKVAALNMGRYSRYGESEHLLNRGTTFKVTSIKEGYPGESLAVVTMSVVK
jgi:hypothetical protein